MLKSYLDESYNNRTMCIGGWLCPEDHWPQIEMPWLERIAYENRISAKKNLKPISRFHASDCSSRVNEFKGWSTERQIRLVKRLIEILRRVKPAGFGFAVRFKDLLDYYPGAKANAKMELYRLCMYGCIKEIVDYVNLYYPGERVTIIHERWEYNSAAEESFERIRRQHDTKRVLVGIMPGGWEDFPALQAADLMAFESFKATDSKAEGYDQVRRSLEKILWSGSGLVIGGFRREFFEDAYRYGVEKRQREQGVLH